ncbi:ARC6/PARC6 family protein [Synechococcus sp. MVIR-18-1]|uniref:ARC6/PARC6 family protein n=1 Tax=Synechococcus sp. MVIR-18-1 TaxID=1386941 RepID=UPI0018604487|nr:ARC6/PARC6 family protein [Synechococcus sp. MVIR-18-1]QNI75819.1 cell division protein ZipN [Synechococcus sp. MVIR-18-1]
MNATLVELPIDHFRLLGVSPSAETESVLRTLQLRLDRCPDQGFTHEVLMQRAELLRLSADLLSDAARRQDYESTLLKLGRDHPEETAGLEMPSSREVAGLMLLWEAHAPHETFQLTRQVLQPPQAPALGSGRESDLALLAALSCRDAARQDQEQRRYESAAGLLTEGLQLLQRMGKLPDHRQRLQTDLEQLTPYRILDLLSRDLAEQTARQEGLVMLETFVQNRGGLEGGAAELTTAGMDQGSFELFFQQIRRFLTVQEQIDLYGRWERFGSSDASFLSVMALAAAGFSQRKPERIQDARGQLQALVLVGLDLNPLLGCMDLLLGDVDRALEHVHASPDADLQEWLANHPSDDLAALFDYCRSWLGRDVLPGYRDVDAQVVDLEAWFADRDVQAYVERLERQEGRSVASADPSATPVSESDWSFGNLPPLGLDPEGAMPLSFGDVDPVPEDSSDPGEEEGRGSGLRRIIPLAWTNLNIRRPSLSRLSLSRLSMSKLSLSRMSVSRMSLPRLSLSRLSVNRPSWPQPRRSVLIGSGVVVVLVVVGFSLVGLRREAQQQSASTSTTNPTEEALPTEDVVSSEPKATLKQERRKPNELIAPLAVEKPSEVQLQALLQTWLDLKATALSQNGDSESLVEVARPVLVGRVRDQQAALLRDGLVQKVQASITSIQTVSSTPSRIEVRAQLTYRDQTMNDQGEVVDETPAGNLPVTYILGRDPDGWRLQAYIPG